MCLAYLATTSRVCRRGVCRDAHDERTRVRDEDERRVLCLARRARRMWVVGAGRKRMDLVDTEDEDRSCLCLQTDWRTRTRTWTTRSMGTIFGNGRTRGYSWQRACPFWSVVRCCTDLNTTLSKAAWGIVGFKLLTSLSFAMFCFSEGHTYGGVLFLGVTLVLAYVFHLWREEIDLVNRLLQTAATHALAYQKHTLAATMGINAFVTAVVFIRLYFSCRTRGCMGRLSPIGSR